MASSSPHAIHFFGSFAIEGKEIALCGGDVIEYIPTTHTLQVRRGEAVVVLIPAYGKTTNPVKLCDAVTFQFIAKMMATTLKMGIRLESPEAFSGTLIATP